MSGRGARPRGRPDRGCQQAQAHGGEQRSEQAFGIGGDAQGLVEAGPHFLGPQ